MTAIHEVIEEALRREREAICAMLKSAEAGTDYERALGEVSDWFDRNAELLPAPLRNQLARLMARLCTTGADELAEWQRLIRARGGK